VAVGEMIVVRYADDLVVGFKSRAEADAFSASFENGWPSSVWNCMRKRRG